MEIPVSSREWIPARSVPERSRTQIKAIIEQPGRDCAAVRCDDGTCYMGFKQNGRIYYGISR